MLYAPKAHMRILSKFGAVLERIASSEIAPEAGGTLRFPSLGFDLTYIS
ncbi:MAG: hypothetical protein ACKOPH_08605 [Methylocystis sp.]